MDGVEGVGNRNALVAPGLEAASSHSVGFGLVLAAHVGSFRWSERLSGRNGLMSDGKPRFHLAQGR